MKTLLIILYSSDLLKQQVIEDGTRKEATKRPPHVTSAELQKRAA